MTDNWKRRLTTFWLQWVKPIMIVLIVFGSFRSAIADWNDVPTGSMKPTIIEGDRIFVNKLAYGLRIPFTTWRVVDWDGPDRGDVVVFFAPDSGVRMVKRVIGVPGDRIAVDNNVLMVNDQVAAYGPLDTDVIDSIDEAQRPLHRFASEDLGGHPHPVMTTPLQPSRRDFKPIVVPERQYFLMGDNRDNSRDSRWFGCVDRSAIVGRATAIVMSLNPENFYLPRFERFFHGLP